MELFEESGGQQIVVSSYTVKGMTDARIVGGYGLTHGVPIDFMTEWLKRNPRHPAVVNGSIFMHDTTKGAEARAREGREIATGLGAIDPLSKSDKRRKGVTLDKDGEAAYKKQIAENPVRNVQQVE